MRRSFVKPAFGLAALLLALLAAARAEAASLPETIAAVWPKVVKIYGAGGVGDLEPYSTGFFVTAEGHVATVWNHVLDAERVTVVLNDGRRFEARLTGAEPTLDLAILKLESDQGNFPHFDLEDFADVSPGTRVLAFSNMFGIAAGDEPVSVVHGVIAAKTPLAARRGVYQTTYRGQVYVIDAVTNNSGAGGGVVTTWDGRLVGMIGKELRNAQSNTWVNYAIPASELASMARQIITGQFESTASRRKEPRNPRRFDPLDFGIVLVPDVVLRTPAYVDAVLPGSPAAEAGLKPDDLIVFVNGELVQSCRALKNAFGWLEPGERLRLTIRRGNRLMEMELKAPPQ
ncbi:MAG: PDZ domain-containing protein [Planctomycetes bacterium]|nr:PDZ domain-containing protein [Planctomycetota bacterium]